jgi:Ca2+/H+ antiporter
LWHADQNPVNLLLAVHDSSLRRVPSCPDHSQSDLLCRTACCACHRAEGQPPQYDRSSLGKIGRHTLLLIVMILPIVLLAEQLAKLVDHGIAVLKAPPALGGVLIALIVFTPEAMSALRAALGNQLQRAVNLCLGAVSSTIGLTVPAILVIGLITGQSVVLGLPQPAWSFSRSHSCSARSRSADRPQPFWRARCI